MDWIEADAFELLREYEANGARYDTIVLDPPAFAKSKRAAEGAMRGYKELNLRAMKMLRPGGAGDLLVLPPCGAGGVYRGGRGGGLGCGTAGAGARAPGRAPDHPAVLTLPETSYLKCLICVVD